MGDAAKQGPAPASVGLDELSPGAVGRDLKRRLARGAVLAPSGDARKRPGILFSSGYTPRHRLSLFETTFYLSGVRQNQDIRFFVAYVAPDTGGRPARKIYPRLFYKDVSLVWRAASHFVRSDYENWIGKGEVKYVREGDYDREYSDEATTDLPLEMQTALETAIRGVKRIPRDERAVALVLRRGPDNRVMPYPEFTEPRRRAREDRRKVVNGGRKIARFTRQNDPTSLRFVRGFEPDFRSGIVERSRGVSRLYGGPLRRFRIVSTNRKAQYLFFAARRQVWIGSCQPTTTDLTSFGVRTLDAKVDEDVLLPGFEYHFLDTSEDPPEFVSQIPEGYAGRVSENDPSRADASQWLDQVPVIRAFRKQVLGRAG